MANMVLFVRLLMSVHVIINNVHATLCSSVVSIAAFDAATVRTHVLCRVTSAPASLLQLSD